MMRAMSKIKIALADDHEMIRSGLRSLIEAEADLEVVWEAEDGREALALIGRTNPDVLLLDISMPEMNGLRFLQKLAPMAKKPHVLVLTGFDDGAYLRQMMSHGAAGYLLKRAAARELIAAIRTVASGRIYIDSALTKLVVSGFVSPRAGKKSGEGDELTLRESEVMRLMARGFTNKEIAARLVLSVKTVETHKAKLMGKLGLRSRAEIVQYAIRLGVLEEDGD
jgi:DNA-binding NarL/FixJ family response regulator